jgi:hypothetical protein
VLGGGREGGNRGGVVDAGNMGALATDALGDGEVSFDRFCRDPKYMPPLEEEPTTCVEWAPGLGDGCEDLLMGGGTVRDATDTLADLGELL